jgi:hypothetical protein
MKRTKSRRYKRWCATERPLGDAPGRFGRAYEAELLTTIGDYAQPPLVDLCRDHCGAAAIPLRRAIAIASGAFSQPVSAEDRSVPATGQLVASSCAAQQVQP